MLSSSFVQWNKTRKMEVDDFTDFRVLGRGGFGLVSGVNRKASGGMFANKIQNKVYLFVYMYVYVYIYIYIYIYIYTYIQHVDDKYPSPPPPPLSLSLSTDTHIHIIST